MTASIQMTLKQGATISIDPDAEGHKGFHSLFLNGGRAGAELAGRIGERESAEMFAAAWQLCDMLDDVSASLENSLLHHGQRMTPEDRQARSARCAEARALVARLRTVQERNHHPA